MFNTAETPRGRRRKVSLLSTLKKTNSSSNLMNFDDDENAGSNEEHEETISAGNMRQRKPAFKRSNSTGNLMDDPYDSDGSDADLIFFQQAHKEANPDFFQRSKAGDDTADNANGRGRGKMSLLVHTLKRSSSKSRLLDEDSGRSDVGSKDIEPPPPPEAPEDTDSYTTPRSDKRKKPMPRAGDLGSSSHHSARSGRSSRKRVSKAKSPSRPLEDSEHSSRMSNIRERQSKVGQEKRLSRGSDDLTIESFDQLVQKKEQMEALEALALSPRMKKKKSKSKLPTSGLDLASPIAKKKQIRRGRCKSSNDSIMYDASTISTKDMTASPLAEDKGYESDGLPIRKKPVPKIGKKKAPVKDVVVRLESPHQAKKQSIMDELDKLEDHQSMTTLQRQIEALMTKVENLASKNVQLQQLLDEEIDQNGKMEMALHEHELGLAALEKANEAAEVRKKEQEIEKRELQALVKEKDRSIATLQQKINSIRVANDTMQMQRDTTRKTLTETHGDDVESLQKKVEIRDAKIDVMMMKLLVLDEQCDNSKVYIKDLKGELKEALDGKKQLEAELKKVKKEHAKETKRKDETIDFLQEALTSLKLKEGKKRDKQRAKERGRTASPFSLKKKQRSPATRDSAGAAQSKQSPARRLSIRNYLGNGDSASNLHNSTSNLDIPF